MLPEPPNTRHWQLPCTAIGTPIGPGFERRLKAPFSIPQHTIIGRVRRLERTTITRRKRLKIERFFYRRTATGPTPPGRPAPPLPGGRALRGRPLGRHVSKVREKPRWGAWRLNWVAPGPGPCAESRPPAGRRDRSYTAPRCVGRHAAPWCGRARQIAARYRGATGW